MFLTHNKFEVVNEQIWYLDSGCSNDMIGNKKLFTHFEEIISIKVWFGNNNKVDTIDKGSIAFKVNTDKIMHIHDALHVPMLK